MEKIVNYFESENKSHWQAEIARSDWDAGEFLARLLKENELEEYVGNVKVLMLVDGEELISYCTYADKDDIQPTDLTPWIGWVYTFPKHRGRRNFGKLLAKVEELAKADGVKAVYISTNDTGLYEKYGAEFFGIMNDYRGDPSRVYVKKFE